jgi:hypothetical protein
MSELIAIGDVTYKQIDEQVAARENLIKQMVGQLYPSILAKEIHALRSWQDTWKYGYGLEIEK